MPIRHHVVLDTDIATDVDDAMAFAMILGAPEIDLLAVTTVYGDTALRARLTKRLAALANRSVVAIPGMETTLSGREIWWAGHEGSLHTALDAEEIDDEVTAVDYLTRTVAQRPGEIDIIAIGPLTNIAAAIQSDEAFAANVKHLWIMGGEFTETQTEHNFRSDDIAASVVFSSKIPITVTGLEITEKVRMLADQLAEIAGSGPLGLALEADIKQWWQFWNEEWNVPHDPVTVLTLLEPELFSFSDPGVVSIRHGGESAGWSSFTPSESGNVRLVTKIHESAVARRIVALISTASAIPESY